MLYHSLVIMTLFGTELIEVDYMALQTGTRCDNISQMHASGSWGHMHGATEGSTLNGVRQGLLQALL
jgi:hypothetical protein